MRKKFIKSLYTEDNYKMYLDLIKAMKIPYTLTMSNYTMKIESECINIQFMRNHISDKAFILGAMVAKDLKESGIVPPDVDREEMKYFNFAIPQILKQAEKKEVYNIDIKSAYASILSSYKLLQPKTDFFLKSVSKRDRLAALGMLASRKDVFTHDGTGEAIEHTVIRKDTANWFFFCVNEVNKLMEDIKKEVGNDFLFYWVDGIFFTGKRKEFIQDFLISKGHQSSYDNVTNLKYFEVDETKYLSYFKGSEKKVLNLPKENNEAEKYVLKFLKINNNGHNTKNAT